MTIFERIALALVVLTLWLGTGGQARGAEVTLDWIAERPGGTYMILADDEGFIYLTTGVHLLKYDSDGNELWAEALDSVSGTRSVGRWIDRDPFGNIFVVGANSAIPNGFLTMKYDTDGNQLWEELLPQTINPKRIATDAAGNAYVIGTTPNATLTSWVTAKYDSEGRLAWKKIFEAGPINNPFALAVSPDGDVAVTGKCNIVGNEYDIVTAVYDTDGTLRWWRSHTATIPGGGQDEGRSVVFGPAGEIYVGGHSENSDFYPDMTVIKYDADGNELWVRDYDGPDHLFDHVSWIALDSNGDVVVSGYSNGNVATLKYDPDGNLLWERQYNGGFGGQNTVWHMVIGPDDAIYIVGENGVQFIMAFKYDSEGTLQWSTYFDIPGTFPDRATSVAIDAGNNVALGVKYPTMILHYLQSECSLGPPPEVGGVTVAPNGVSWSPGTNGEQYDVARGDLSSLTLHGMFPCIVTETANPFCSDSEPPVSGGIFFYLVRGTSVCGIGSWGSGTTDTARYTTCP